MTTILELAQRAGFKTGNVSTAEITDATPAVLDSHINDRGCQGPANMATCGPSKKENGGPGSIAEQSVDHHVNVLLGGGLARFQQLITGGPHVGKTVVQSAQLQGYTSCSTPPTSPASTTIACWACSTPATCRSSGAACRRRLSRAAASPAARPATRISGRPTSRRLPR